MFGSKTMRIRELEEQVNGLRRDLADKDSRIAGLACQIKAMEEKAAHPTTDADVAQAMRDAIVFGLNEMSSPSIYGPNITVMDISFLVLGYTIFSKGVPSEV